jgi:hypothetical protein
MHSLKTWIILLYKMLSAHIEYTKHIISCAACLFLTSAACDSERHTAPPPPPWLRASAVGLIFFIFGPCRGAIPRTRARDLLPFEASPAQQVDLPRGAAAAFVSYNIYAAVQSVTQCSRVACVHALAVCSLTYAALVFECFYSALVRGRLGGGVNRQIPWRLYTRGVLIELGFPRVYMWH